MLLRSRCEVAIALPEGDRGDTGAPRLAVRVTIGDVAAWPLNTLWEGKGDDKPDTRSLARYHEHPARTPGATVVALRAPAPSYSGITLLTSTSLVQPCSLNPEGF